MSGLFTGRGNVEKYTNNYSDKILIKPKHVATLLFFKDSFLLLALCPLLLSLFYFQCESWFWRGNEEKLDLELEILVILFMKCFSEELILIMQKLQRPASVIINFTVDIQTSFNYCESRSASGNVQLESVL